MVAHGNSSMLGAKTGGSLRVLVQPGLHIETVKKSKLAGQWGRNLADPGQPGLQSDFLDRKGCYTNKHSKKKKVKIEPGEVAQWFGELAGPPSPTWRLVPIC